MSTPVACIRTRLVEVSQSLFNLAEAYRGQADALKKSKKKKPDEKRR
jgi:hypothetical protein